MSTDGDQQRQELRLSPGVAGSGRRRYAAAMWFHCKGEIAEEVLEVYRSLALDDRTDPQKELERIGLPRWHEVSVEPRDGGPRPSYDPS